MKIIVFGATGKTGIKVVEQGLEQGLEIKAFVRTPGKMIISHSALSISQGDVTNAVAVEDAIKGMDAVIVALGASPDMQSDLVMTEGTTNIINAMKKHAVKRLIVQTSYGMSGSPEGIAFLKQVGMGEEQIAMIKPLLNDKAKQETSVRESGLDFLIVQPMMLTDTEKTGKYRVAEKLEVKPGDVISRADVADFMLKSLTQNELLGKTIVMAY